MFFQAQSAGFLLHALIIWSFLACYKYNDIMSDGSQRHQENPNSSKPRPMMSKLSGPQAASKSCA